MKKRIILTSLIALAGGLLFHAQTRRAQQDLEQPVSLQLTNKPVQELLDQVKTNRLLFCLHQP